MSFAHRHNRRLLQFAALVAAGLLYAPTARASDEACPGFWAGAWRNLKLRLSGGAPRAASDLPKGAIPGDLSSPLKVPFGRVPLAASELGPGASSAMKSDLMQRISAINMEQLNVPMDQLGTRMEIQARAALLQSELNALNALPKAVMKTAEPTELVHFSAGQHGPSSLDVDYNNVLLDPTRQNHIQESTTSGPGLHTVPRASVEGLGADGQVELHRIGAGGRWAHRFAIPPGTRVLDLEDPRVHGVYDRLLFEYRTLESVQADFRAAHPSAGRGGAVDFRETWLQQRVADDIWRMAGKPDIIVGLASYTGNGRVVAREVVVRNPELMRTMVANPNAPGETWFSSVDRVR
jgi:hypothetical protein